MAKLQADGKAAAPAPCYPFLAFVFNLDQTEGISRPIDDVPAAINSPLEEAQKIVDAMPNRPEIRHGTETFNPCYMGVILVVMPNLGQFKDAESYFCALHHELIRLGAKSRLNRFEKQQGESREERYGFEELVAELGAAFLSATCGLDNSSRLDDASAVAGWLKAFQDDKSYSCKRRAPRRAAPPFIGKLRSRRTKLRVAA